MLGTATLANRKMRQEMKEVVRLINSTSLHLAGVGAQWSRFSADVCGAKAHVVYDPDLARPVYHSVTAANVNDITAAKEMPIEAGATYVFDLGYYDYGWWARLDAADCRIVTRFKTHTPLLDAKDMRLPAGSCALSDRIGFLPSRQAKNRMNPMRAAVREVVVMTDTGKRLRILSNDLDAPADDIADLYKRRWQIELFFRLMKQTLRIRSFIGRSQNAVRIQIAAALIAHRSAAPAKSRQVKPWVPRTRSTCDQPDAPQILPEPERNTAHNRAITDNTSSTGAMLEPDSRATSRHARRASMNLKRRPASQPRLDFPASGVIIRT